MGITHGDHTAHHGLLVHPQQVGLLRLLRPERHLGRLKLGDPHVDGDLIILLQLQHDTATHGADRNAILVGQPLEAHKAGKAAGAVATLLHLGTIGIVDAIVEILLRIVGRLHQQQLIEADTEVAVGKTTNGLGGEVNLLGHPIHHHEVIAEAMHLGKKEFHTRASGQQVFKAPEIAQWLALAGQMIPGSIYQHLGRTRTGVVVGGHGKAVSTG